METTYIEPYLKKEDFPVLAKEMKRRKEELGLSYGELAKRAGLPTGTVQKILGGFTKAPRYATMAALHRTLFPEKYECRTGEENMDTGKEGTPAVSYPSYSSYPSNQDSCAEPFMLREPAPVYLTGQTIQRNSLADVRREAYRLIDRLPKDSVEAVIQVMRRMVSVSDGESMAAGSRQVTPKMQAFLDMQAMRKSAAEYDLSDAQRGIAVEEKYGRVSYSGGHKKGL